jgi:hypothetical protein
MAILDFPASPTLNQVYTNPTTGSYTWNGYAWDHVLPTGVVIGANQYKAKMLAIGGGGGSQGFDGGGGGGAGGFVEQEFILTIGTVCHVVIGAGGQAGSGQSAPASGYPTIVQGAIPALGGGHGGYAASYPGDNGASSGGGGTSTLAGIAVLGGSQGHIGAPNKGGGGGAGAAAIAGTGGIGKSSSISGVPVTYAKGGNGFGAGANGAANTGNGADAGSSAGLGGSGIAYLEIPTAKYSGTITGSPKVTVVGANTVLEFKTSGTYTG